jgi:hypothetical protein
MRLYSLEAAGEKPLDAASRVSTLLLVIGYISIISIEYGGSCHGFGYLFPVAAWSCGELGTSWLLTDFGDLRQESNARSLHFGRDDSVRKY